MVANSYEFNLYVFVQSGWIFMLVFSFLKSLVFISVPHEIGLEDLSLSYAGV